jgi:hypothetical protein
LDLAFAGAVFFPGVGFDGGDDQVDQRIKIGAGRPACAAAEEVAAD